MNHILETIYDTIAPNYETWKKTPLRERHFNSIITCYLIFLCGFIKLQGAPTGEHSMVSFSQHGTWAHLGTQPFIFGSMLGNLVDAEWRGSLVLGMMFSTTPLLGIDFLKSVKEDPPHLARLISKI